MKQRNVILQILTPFATAALLVVFTVGCGRRFETALAEIDSRPPASSDPLTAEDQRRWDAAERSEMRVAPVLESDFERESFLDDVTEQKPAHTDEELAEEAEKEFVARKNTPAAPRKSSPSSPSSPASPSSPSSKAPPSSPSSPARPSPVQNPPANTSAPPSPSPANPVKPTAPAQVRPRPLRPVPSLRSEFCESLNVTSATAKTDTSQLYNTSGSAPVAMPSKELSTANSQDKKNRFVCLVLPMAIRMNEEVYRMRIEVLRLQAKEKKGTPLSTEDQEWMADMYKSFDVKAPVSFEELLKRVDIVPLPLLLAQAAIESGWGTSRATVDLKNLFGIHAVRNQPCKVGYDTKNACVRQFPSLEAGVSAYIQLINAGGHYAKFREGRAQMRKAGESLDSVKLLATLGSYNETPVQYIRNVREIMTGSNKLTQFVFKEDAVMTDGKKPASP
jgi:uncharacterized FlgJ-related protein